MTYKYLFYKIYNYFFLLINVLFNKYMLNYTVCLNQTIIFYNFLFINNLFSLSRARALVRF